MVRFRLVKALRQGQDAGRVQFIVTSGPSKTTPVRGSGIVVARKTREDATRYAKVVQVSYSF